ncbi:hypothetical protein SUDANB121_03941 [Nocardiopsis dassonvillei]
MSCVGRIFVWTMIALLPLFTVGLGLFLVSEALSGRDTLATGPTGTFTPTDRTCGRGGCSLQGTFTGDDGAVALQDVTLRDAVRVRSHDPLPDPIGGVRLDTGAEKPIAYTADYSWRWAVVKGAGFTAVGPAISIGLAVGTIRHQAGARPAHRRGR